MRNVRKWAVGLTCTLLISVISACGQSSKNESSAETQGSSPQSVTVDFYVSDTHADASKASNWLGLKDQFEQKNPGIKINFKPLSGSDDDIMKKMDIALNSGDTTDVLELKSPTFETKYASAGLLKPLGDLAKEENVDLDKEFGKFLKRTNDQVYYLPYEFTADILFYNKKIFDEAKVPYPTGNMTWDQYVELAKKLTDPSKGIYGSLMQQWAYYLYIPASQKKVSAYKPDGTSNFDDPAFKESLKFFHDLSNEYKVQPSWGEMISKKLQWDSYLSGKFGMQVTGSWLLQNASDFKTYPRDWKLGVAASPTPADAKNMLTAGGAVGINNKSAHPKEAFKVAQFFAENVYTTGTLPPRADFTPEKYKEVLKKYSDDLKGEVSVDELYNAIFNNGLGAVDEQITGPASAQIQDVLVKESEKYFFDKQTLDETMDAVKKQADQFIADANTQSK